MARIPFKSSAPSGEYDARGSVSEAFSPLSILKRLVLFVLFGLLLGIKQIISAIDGVGKLGGGAMNYISAIFKAVLSATGLALGSMWIVITNPSLYIQHNLWGSFFFALFSLVVLIFFFFQPVSFIFNILDGKRGEATGVFLRLIATVILLLIMSCVTFYAFGGQTLATDIKNGNFEQETQTNYLPTYNQTVPNETVTNNPVIDLNG